MKVLIGAAILSLCALFSSVSSAGVIEVHLASQTFRFYDDDGKLLRSGPISSGKKGYRTPTGVFRVLGKARSVYSEKYRARMPFALRFRGNKYFIHQGRLPGYPQSHGCVRLLKKDAQFLFAKASVGDRVIIRY